LLCAVVALTLAMVLAAAPTRRPTRWSSCTSRRPPNPTKVPTPRSRSRSLRERGGGAVRDTTSYPEGRG
jgi:hypothetical protein